MSAHKVLASGSSYFCRIDPNGRFFGQHSDATTPFATLPEDQAITRADMAQAQHIQCSEFDEEDRRRGDRVRRIVGLTVLRAIFEVGPALSEAFSKFDRMNVARGRNSRYGKWLQFYLPTFDRKTLDRWRRAYEAFAPLVKDEIRTECLDFFNRFQLTAVYALTNARVTDKQRQAAIRLAQSGEFVGMERISQILGAMESVRAPLFQKTIPLPAGRIKVSINHEDFRQALQEAIWQLDDESAAPHQSRDVERVALDCTPPPLRRSRPSVAAALNLAKESDASNAPNDQAT